MIRCALPNAVTFLGAVLFVLWLAGLAPWYVGALGLLCDALDGYTARRLGVTSRFGSLYDWTTDVTFAALLLGRFASHTSPVALLALPALVLGQVANRLDSGMPRISGRAALFVLCLVWENLRP